MTRLVGPGRQLALAAITCGLASPVSAQSNYMPNRIVPAVCCTTAAPEPTAVRLVNMIDPGNTPAPGHTPVGQDSGPVGLSGRQDRNPIPQIAAKSYRAAAPAEDLLSAPALPAAWEEPPVRPAPRAPAPRVTQGTVVFEDLVLLPADPVRPIDAGALERRLRAVCADRAREVCVRKQSDGKVLVQVTASAGKEDQMLVDKLSRVEELAAPEVRLEVRLEQ